MFCRGCGKEIPDDAVVCVGCGRAAGAPKQEDQNGLMIAGFITAMIMPVVGLIIGVILLAKSKVGVGLGVIVLSVVAWAMWCAAMMPSGTPNP